MPGETWSDPDLEPWETLENFGPAPLWEPQIEQTLEDLFLRITYADRRDMLIWVKENYHKFRKQQKIQATGQRHLFKMENTL